MTFDEIKADIQERMSAYTGSTQPTKDEISIAFLVSTIDKMLEVVDEIEEIINK